MDYEYGDRLITEKAVSWLPCPFKLPGRTQEAQEMSIKWITVEEILKQYDKQPFELVPLIKDLIIVPIDRVTGKKYITVKNFGKVEFENLYRKQNYSWFIDPDSFQYIYIDNLNAAQLTEFFGKVVFCVEDVEAAFEQPLNKTTVKKMLPSQKYKKEAIESVRVYITQQNTKKKPPVIKDAVELIQKKLIKGKYKDRTIHDWIKDYFPDESRKPGRPRKK